MEATVGDTRHDRRLLARCHVCEVEHCPECDVVHVNVGHASLRLTRSGFYSLCATLLEAARAAEKQRLATGSGLQ